MHAIVPGGGPSLDQADSWKSARPPVDRTYHDHWLVDADQLRVVFRDQFLSGLKRLHARGALKLNGEWSFLRDADSFAAWLVPLESQDWVTYIQPPPTQSSEPADVVKYLARYLTGGPISDYRITDYNGREVTFTARTGNTRGGRDKTEPISLPVTEFVRRWSLHILPRGYTKSRRFGGLSNYHAARYIAECRRLMHNTTAEPTGDGLPVAAPDFVGDSSYQAACCPACGGELYLLHAQHRTSWRDIMRGPNRPHWYDPPHGARDG